jgi:hypothetical protein
MCGLERYINDDTKFVAHGAQGYNFTANDLDRTGGFDVAVNERNRANGLIEFSATKLETYQKIRP